MLEMVNNYVVWLSEGGWVGAIPIFVGLLLWLASGCIASTIAEIRLRSPILHLLGGLIIPGVYPLAVLFMMPVKQQKVEKQEEEVEHVEGPPPVEQTPLSGTAITEDFSDEGDIAYNQAYFKKICFDSEGNHRGPFIIDVGDDELRVEKIVDCLLSVCVIEITNADGKAQTLRIPYDRVKSCTDA
jgi:hypothetical protein